MTPAVVPVADILRRETTIGACVLLRLRVRALLYAVAEALEKTWKKEVDTGTSVW